MSSRRLLLAAGLASLGSIASAKVFAGANYYFSTVLHAVVGQVTSCHPAEGVACPCDGSYEYPNTTVPPNTEITVFLIIQNWCLPSQLAGVQTAFEWDQSWTLVDTDWACRPNQVTSFVPQAPGGSSAGALSTAFNCSTSDSVVVVGRLYFVTGAGGCLRQVAPDLPFGICALDCDNQVDRITGRLQDLARIGAICVSPSGGWPGCWDPGPVDPATWGHIKAVYHY